MGEEHREQVDLIPNPGAGGYISECVVGFELGQAPLLAAAAVVEDGRPWVLQWTSALLYFIGSGLLRVCVCLRKHIILRSADRFLDFLIMRSAFYSVAGYHRR